MELGRQRVERRYVRLMPLVLLLAQPVAAQSDLPASLLPAGPYPVGFRHTWAFDEGRTYRTAFDQGVTYGAKQSPRPLLVLQWYPAQDRAPESGQMAHREYFSIESTDPRLTRFAEALGAFARDIFVRQVMGRAEGELSAAEVGALEHEFAAPASCQRDAEPAQGPFPVVLYHGGAGSSFEDNAALCVYLASHGFVVFGGAFQKADGSSLAVDGGRGSAEDFQYLARFARGLPYADPGQLAIAGHSLGAQAALRAAAHPNSVMKALVLLDTTLDYYGMALPLHDDVEREVSEGSAHLTQAMLVAAGPEATFELLDSLVHAHRTYLTVPELGHDEYTSQGLQRLERIEHGPRTAEEEADLARLPQVRANYRHVCETVRAFLDAQLGRSAADLAARVAHDQSVPWTHEAPRLVAVPCGVDAPERWNPANENPPTPRQYRRYFHEEGVQAACTVLRRFRKLQPRGPLYTSTMLSGSLLFELASRGNREEAAAYYAALKEIDLDALSLFTFLADISMMRQQREEALRYLEIARDLDPEDARVKESLAKLGR